MVSKLQGLGDLVRTSTRVALFVSLAVAILSLLGTVAIGEATEPPVWKNVTLPDGEQDQYYSFNLTVTDPDTPREELTLTDDCDMFDISQTGQIGFVPKNEHVGDHTFNVTARDPQGNTATQEYELFIVNVNDPPVLRAIPPQTAHEDQVFILGVYSYVEDPDLLLPPEFRDRITYRDDTPKLDTNLETGEVVWDSPTNDDVGDFFFTLTISDSKGRHAQQEVKISVVNTNDAPEIGIIGKQILVQERPYHFNIPWVDDDMELDGVDEEVTFTNEPTDLFVIDAATGRISFTPENKHTGIWHVTLRVTDAEGLYDEKVVVFEVQNENDRPVVDYIPVMAVDVGELFELQVVARDPDMEPRLVDGEPVDPNEALSYRTNSSRVQIDPVTGVITWTPTVQDARIRNFIVRVTVVDTYSETASVDLMLEVVDSNDPPSVSVAGVEANDVVRTDTEYPLSAVAEDDNDAFDRLTFRWYLGDDQLGQGPDLRWTPEGDGPAVLTLEVEDTEGAKASLELPVMIAWIPPVPTLVSVTNGSVYDTDETIDFSISIETGDIPPGRTLSVQVTSDIDGDLGTYTVEEAAELTFKGLSKGRHTIEVTVSDSQHTSSTALEVLVNEPSVETSGASALVWVVVAVIAVVAVLLLTVLMRGERNR